MFTFEINIDLLILLHFVVTGGNQKNLMLKILNFGFNQSAMQ